MRASRPRLFRRSTLSETLKALEADRRSSTVGWVGLVVGAYCERILGLWTSTWTAIAFELVALCLITTNREFPRRLRLGRVGASAFVAATLLIGGVVAITGGPRSPYIPMLALPVGMIAAPFSLRDVIAALSLTMAVAILVTTSVYSHVGIGEPPSLALKLALIVIVALVVWGLRAGKVLHNDEPILDPITGWLDSGRLLTGFIMTSQDARVMGEPVSVIVCDIRHVKTNGKRCRCPNDALLREVAHAMRSVMRPFENVYRLWGGTIAIVLPRTGIHSAISFAHCLRDVVDQTQLEGGSVAISFGISASHGSLIDFNELLDTAGTVLEATSAHRAHHPRKQLNQGGAHSIASRV